MLGVKCTFFSRIQYSYVFWHFLFIIWSQCQSSLFCPAIYSNVLRFPQSCDRAESLNISASHPERFLVTNYFWKLSLSYMPTIQQCIKFKIMKYYLHSSNHVAFIRVCQLNCASLKLFIQVTACSHISHCLSCGGGVLEHSYSRWIITFEMIFWNIFNVTALVLLLCHHYILVIRRMLNTFGNSICTWSDPKKECFLDFQNWLMITCC